MAANLMFWQGKRVAVGLALALMALCLTADVGWAAAPQSAVAQQASTKTTVPCQRPAQGFKPVEARIPALGRTVRVILVKRTSSGAVGAGPTTEAGKWLMAMDPLTRPASGRGSVLLSGHTWPDGSALGNAMLKKLGSGHRIILVGKYGEQACYGIYKRESYPKDQVPTKEAFRSGGPEQLVIVTCSGKRTSPGNWTRRTLWYALPVGPEAPPPPTSSNPPSKDNSPSLLGGLLGGLFGGG